MAKVVVVHFIVGVVFAEIGGLRDRALAAGGTVGGLPFGVGLEQHGAHQSNDRSLQAPPGCR